MLVLGPEVRFSRLGYETALIGPIALAMQDGESPDARCGYSPSIRVDR